MEQDPLGTMEGKGKIRKKFLNQPAVDLLKIDDVASLSRASQPMPDDLLLGSTNGREMNIRTIESTQLGISTS
jgi:hypothetical protein